MSKNSSSKASRTDFERLRRMRDEEIDLSDIPEITPEQWAQSVVRKGLEPVPSTKRVTLQIDADVLDWFQRLGKGYKDLINALLREYVKAQRKH